MTKNAQEDDSTMADVRKIRCEKGHFYDGAVFVKCPFCEAGGIPDSWTNERRNKIAANYLRTHLNNEENIAAEDTADAATGERSGGRREPIAPLSSPKPNPSADDNKTIKFSVNNQENYYVAGWLVCVGGPHMGYSYNLYFGYNTIGRSKDNDICLLEDLTIGQKIHCSVAYEDRKNCFYLIPENGEDTCLNCKKIESPSNLQTGDVIRIGMTELEFVAFCRGERRWDRVAAQKAAGRRKNP